MSWRLRDQPSCFVILGLLFIAAGFVWRWCIVGDPAWSSVARQTFIHSVMLGIFTIGGFMATIGLGAIIRNRASTELTTSRQDRLLRILRVGLIVICACSGALALVGIIASRVSEHW